MNHESKTLKKSSSDCLNSGISVKNAMFVFPRFARYSAVAQVI